MSNSKLEVSVITVVKNASETIEGCLESVANQTYENVHHILVDGNSTDGTTELIEAFIKSRNRANYHHIIGKDNSLWHAMNIGLEESSSSDFVIFLNSDDVFCESCFIEMAMRQMALESLELLYGPVLIGLFNDDKFNVLRTYPAYDLCKRNLVCGLMPPHPGTVFRRSLFLDYGLYTEDWKQYAPDFEFYVRLMVGEVKYSIVDRPSVYMSMNGVSHTNKTYIFSRARRQVNSLSLNSIYSSYLVIFMYKIYKLFKRFFGQAY